MIMRAMPLFLFAAMMVGIGNAHAQSLLDKLTDTATEVGNRVNEELKSTQELFEGQNTPEETRQYLDRMAEAALQQLFSEHPDSKKLLDQSAGYAVFDSRKITVLVAAAYGRGVAVDRKSGQKTYMKMGTLGVGFMVGVGGFDNKIIILIEKPSAFHQFITDGYDATAESKAITGDSQAQSETRFVEGRKVYVLTKSGWVVSASLSGTKYWKDDELN